MRPMPRMTRKQTLKELAILVAGGTVLFSFFSTFSAFMEWMNSL